MKIPSLEDFQKITAGVQNPANAAATTPALPSAQDFVSIPTPTYAPATAVPATPEQQSAYLQKQGMTPEQAQIYTKKPANYAESRSLAGKQQTIRTQLWAKAIAAQEAKPWTFGQKAASAVSKVLESVYVPVAGVLGAHSMADFAKIDTDMYNVWHKQEKGSVAQVLADVMGVVSVGYSAYMIGSMINSGINVVQFQTALNKVYTPEWNRNMAAINQERLLRNWGNAATAIQDNKNPPRGPTGKDWVGNDTFSSGATALSVDSRLFQKVQDTEGAMWDYFARGGKGGTPTHLAPNFNDPVQSNLISEWMTARADFYGSFKTVPYTDVAPGAAAGAPAGTSLMIFPTHVPQPAAGQTAALLRIPQGGSLPVTVTGITQVGGQPMATVVELPNPVAIADLILPGDDTPVSSPVATISNQETGIAPSTPTISPVRAPAAEGVPSGVAEAGTPFHAQSLKPGEIEVYHFSPNLITEVDPRKWGTGPVPGAERNTKMFKDPSTGEMKPYPGNLATSDWYLKGTPPDPHLLGYFLYRGVIDGATLLQVDYDNSKVPVPDDVTLKAAGFTGIQYHSTSPWPNQVRLFDITPVTLVGKSQVPPGYDAQHYSAGLAAQSVGPIDPSLLTAKELKTALDQGTLAVVGITVGVPANAPKALADQIEAENAARVRTLRNKGYTIMDGAFGAGPEKSIIALPQEAEALARKFGSSIPGVQTIQQSFITMDHGKYLMWSWDKDSDTYMVSMTGSHIAYDNKLEDFFTSTPIKGGEPLMWSIDDLKDVSGGNGGEAGLASQAGTAGLKEASPLDRQFPEGLGVRKGNPGYDAIDKAYRKDSGAQVSPDVYNADAWHAAQSGAITASALQKPFMSTLTELLKADELLADVKVVGSSKTAGSIYNKMERTGKSIGNLGDLNRVSIVFPTYNGAQMAAFLKQLQTKYDIEMVRSSLTMPNGVNIYGYRDAKLWVYLPNGELAEIQFQTEETMKVRSEIAAAVYDKYRSSKLSDLTPEERTQFQKEVETVKGAYNQLFSSMDQGELKKVEDEIYNASGNSGLNEAAPTVHDMVPGIDEPTPLTLIDMFSSIEVKNAPVALTPINQTYAEVRQAGLNALEEIGSGPDIVTYKEGVIARSINESAIRKEMFENGGALFKGMKFETTAEKSEVFRLMRDPRFEHGATMAIGSSGRILGIQGVSVGLSFYTELYKNDVKIEIPIIDAWTREIEVATGEKVVSIVVVHNHPSTATNPSPDDSRVYHKLIRGLSRADRTVEAIIVDHEEYTAFTLAQSGDVVARKEYSWAATSPTKDPLITPILSNLVTDTESAAIAAMGIMHNPQQGVLIGTDSWNAATFIAIVDAATYSDKAAMTKFIQTTMYGSGARNAILVLDRSLVSPEEVSKAGGLGSLVDEGFLTDVALTEVPTDTTSGYRSVRAALEFQPGYHSQSVREDMAINHGMWLGLHINTTGAMSILEPDGRSAAIRELFDRGVQYNASDSAKKPVSTFIQDEQDVEIAGILADAIATGAVTIDPDGLPVPTNWFPTGLPGKEVTRNGTLFSAKNGMLFVPTAKALAKYNGMFGVKVDFMNKLGAKDYMESAMSFCLGKYDIDGAKKAFNNVMNFMENGAGYVFLFGGNPVSTAASNPYFQAVAEQAQSTIFGEGVQPKARELASLHRAVADRVVDVQAGQAYAHKIYAVARIDSVGVGTFGLTGHPIYSVRLNLGKVTVFNTPLSMEGVLEAYSKGKGLQEATPSSAVNVQNRAEFNLNRKLSIPVAGAEATKAMVKALNAKPTYRPNNPDYTSETDKLLSQGLFENAGQVPQSMQEGVDYIVGDDGALKMIKHPMVINSDGMWVEKGSEHDDSAEMQLSGNAAEYNTDEEERMAALAVKDNIVPPPVADLTDMNAWRTPLEDFAGKWQPGWSEVMRQQYRTNERFWFDRVRYALTTGLISMKAIEFQDAFGDTWLYKKIFDEAYRSMEIMPRQRYYHATSALSKVLASGRLKNREELQAESHDPQFWADPLSTIGLGGGASFTASVSSSIKAARDIAIGLLDAHRVATGELSIDDMIERAKTGSDALRPYIKDLRMGLLLHRMDGSEDREATDSDLLDDVWNEALDDWAKSRENAGGPIDPFIMNQDRRDWAALDPDEIGFVEVEVPPNTRGYQTQELSEWRIVAPEVTKITAAHHIDEVIMGPDFTPRVNGKGLSDLKQQEIINAISKGEWAKGHARTFANGAEFPINNQPFALIKFMVSHAYAVGSGYVPGAGLSLNETGIIGAVIDAIGYNRAAMAEEYQRFDDELRKITQDDQFIGIFKDLVALTSAGERPARNIAAAIQAFDVGFVQGQKITAENGGNFYFSKSPTLRQKINDYFATGEFTGEKMAPYANAQHGDEGASAIDRNITQAFLGKKVSTPAEKAVMWSLIGKASWYIGMTPREGSAQLWSFVRPTPKNQSLADLLASSSYGRNAHPEWKSTIKNQALHMEMARLYGSPTGSFFSKRAAAVDQARKRSIMSDAATRANEPTHIDGIKSMTPNEILEIVHGTVESILQDNNFIPRDGIKIIDARIIGSRTRGTPRANSDLDIVLEYDGGIADLREDDFFNMLHAKDAAMLEIDGIKLDINPIKAKGTGTIAEYLGKDPSRHPLADVVPSWALQRPVAEKYGLIGGGGSAISNFQSSDVYGPFGTGRIYEGRAKFNATSGSLWSGKAYRADTGYRNSKNATAADVVRYEQDELGNELGISDVTIAELATRPASDVVWVTHLKSAARNYGDPEEYGLPSGSTILGEDGDGGYLVLKGNVPQLTRETLGAVQGLEANTIGKLLDMANNDIQNAFDNAGLVDDSVVDVRLIGSRTRGEARTTGAKISDLDFLVQYNGPTDEGTIHEILNNKDNPMSMDGIKVDYSVTRDPIEERLARDIKKHPLGGVYESGTVYRGHSTQFGHEASTLATPTYSESRDVAAEYAADNGKSGVIANVNIDDSKFLTFGTDDGTLSVQDLQAMIKDKALFTKIADQFEWIFVGSDQSRETLGPDDYIDTFDLADNKDFVAWAKKEGYTGLEYHGTFVPSGTARNSSGISEDASYPLEWRPFSPDLVTTLGSSTEGIFEDAVAFVPGDSSGLEEEGIPYTAGDAEPGAISIGEPSNQAKGVIRATSLHTAESRRLDQLQARMAKTLKGMETVRVTQQEFMAVIRAANLGAADITTVLNAYKKATNSDKIWPMLDKVYKSASVQAAKEMLAKDKLKTLTAAQKQTAKELGQAKAQIVAKYILEENHRRVQSEFEDFMNRAGVPASMFRTPAQILNLVDSVKGSKSLQTAEDLVAAKIEATYRSDLTERLKDLKARLQNSKSIAVDYKEKALGLLSDIEFAGHPEKLRAQVQRMLDEVEKQRAAGEDVSLSSKHLKQLDMLSRKPVSNMLTGELIQLIETVEELAGWGSMKQHAREAVYNNEVDAMVKELLPGVVAQDEAARRDIEGLNYIETGIGNASKGLNARDALHRLMLGDKAIWYAFDILGVPQLKTRMDTVFDNYFNMRDTMRDIPREIAARDNLGPKQMRRIGVVLHAEDENGAGVLSEWGLTLQDAANIKKSFSKGEREWYAAARQLLDGLQPQISKSLEENFNRRLGFVKNYFPRYRAAEDVDNLHISDRFGQLYDPATGKAVTESVDPTRKKNVEMSMTKARLATVNKAELNAGRVLERYLDDAAYQIMMTREIRVGKTVIDSADISAALGGLGHEVMAEYYSMMARKGGAVGAATTPWLDTLRQHTGGYQLAWKAASALVQWTQFADVAALVGPRYAYQGLSDLLMSPEWRKFVVRESPKIRNMVGDDPAFLEMSEIWWTKSGMLALKNFDKATRVGAFMATYRAYCEANGLSFNPKEPHAEGIMVAEQMVSRILASPFPEDMPLTLSTGYGIGNKSFARTALEFQNPMLFRATNLAYEVRNLKGQNKTGGAGSVPHGGKGARTSSANAGEPAGNKSKGASLWTLFMMVVFTAALEAGVRRGAKKVMGGTNTDTYMKDVVDQMIGSVPYIGNIWGSLQYGNNPVPAIAMMSDMVGYGSTAYKAYVKGNWRTAMTNTAYFLSMAGGLGGYFPGGSAVTQFMRYNFLDKAAQDRWAGILSPVPENPGPPGNP